MTTMNDTATETNRRSSSSLSRRRRTAGSTSNQPDRLRKRDIEFIHQTVSVVKKIGEFGTSYLYSAKVDASRRRSGKGLFIKATAAATTEQARRAETEVRLLRKLNGSPGIPTIIDCGFSTLEEKFYEHDTEGDRLDARRLYCLLLEPCPDLFLTDFIKKRRRKFKNSGARGLFTRKKKDEVWEGYLPIETIMDIFGQMVSAISAIHWYQDEADTSKGHDDSSDKSTQTKTRGIVHLDIQPSRFLVRKSKEIGNDKERYEINLCSFGCAIRGGLSLASNTDREEASKLIASSTSPAYRSPEMIDMNLTDELNASADIWGLGCCLYELLFLTECFKGQSKLDLLRGVFLLPAKHPYKNEVIELLARMLTVNSTKRATIEEVQNCLACLENGSPLPPQPRSPSNSDDTERSTSHYVSLGEVSGQSNQTEGQATEETKLAPLGSGSLQSLFVDNSGQSDTTDNHQTLDISADGGASSDGTEFSQWLEFKPGSSGGLNLETRTAPLSVSTRVIRRGSMRRRRRYNDPLSLGAASASFGKKDEKKQNLFSDWKLGLINQLSSRSLNPIDTNASDGGSGSGEKEHGITSVPKPSLKKINPYGLALKTKDSPGVRNPYGPGKLLDTMPSLRVSDLMKVGVPHGQSTSSSDIHSSGNDDMYSSEYPSTSSEWHSSAEIPSSSEILSSTELTMSSTDVSPNLARTITPMTDASTKKLTSIEEFNSLDEKGESTADESFDVNTPVSDPVVVGHFQRSSMLNRGVSPNIPPFSNYEATNTSLISPQVAPVESSYDLYSNQVTLSDRRVKTKKLKSKDKSKTKKKSKKKAKTGKVKHRESAGVAPETPSQKGSSAIDLENEGGRPILGNSKLLYQSTTGGTNNSIPEFNADPVDAKNSQRGEVEGVARDMPTDVDPSDGGNLSFNNSKVDNWGSYSSVGIWTGAQEKTPKHRKKHKKSTKEPKSDVALITENSANLSGDKVPSSLSELGAWDLHAIKQWVTTKSNEASVLSPPPHAKERVKASREKDRVDNSQPTIRDDSQSALNVPKNWVTDAEQWVTTKSATKVSKLKREMMKTLSSRSTKAEVDASWFASPGIKDESPLFLPGKEVTDAAGFPVVQEMTLQRTLSEKVPQVRKLKRDSRLFKSSPLDHYFVTPQTQRNKLEVPRSALSTSELSKGGRRRSSHRNLDCPTSNPVSPDRSGNKVKRRKSDSTRRSSKTPSSNKEMSVDTNMPPGDEVVVAEVSVPLTRGSKMSVKDEVHMALTAEGRQMKRSIKKMEDISPHELLSRMLLQEQELRTETKKRSSSSKILVPVRESLVANRNKSVGSISIPSMIELVSVGNDIDLQTTHASPAVFNNRPSVSALYSTRAAAESQRQSHLIRSPDTPSGLQTASPAVIPGNPLTLVPTEALGSPLTPGTEGSKKVKKKKKGKEHKKEHKDQRKAAKKSKSLRITDLEKTPSITPMSKSLTQVSSLTASFAQNLVAMDRLADAMPFNPNNSK